MVLMVCVVVGSDRRAYANPDARKGVFLMHPDSFRLLHELEQCRDTLDENDVLRALNQKANEMEGIRREREKLLRQRIDFLEKQNAELLQMNEQAVEMAKAIRRESGGMWYQKLFEAGKYIGLGVLVGIAIGGL
jgi:hypothetical protein